MCFLLKWAAEGCGGVAFRDGCVWMKTERLACPDQNGTWCSRVMRQFGAKALVFTSLPIAGIRPLGNFTLRESTYQTS